MEVAIFTDLHLGLKSDSQVWHNVVFDWVDSMIDTLNKRNIKNIFFLGDWFHNRAAVSGITLKAAADVLEKLSDFTIWMFPGNHDLYFANQVEVSSVALLKGYSNIKFFDKITKVNLDSTEITLCPWGLNPLDTSIESTEYLFGHFEINTFQMNSSEKLCEEGLKLSDLLRKFTKIFSGHFHKAQKRVYSTGLVQYVGNPFQMNYGEAEEDKGFIILDLKSGNYEYVYNEISPKFIKMPLSRLVNLDITELPTVFTGNFVRLICDMSITADDMNELVRLISVFKPEELDIDWDNTGFSSTSASNINFEAFELIKAISEFTKLLDIENQKDILDYLEKVHASIDT